MKWDKHFIDMCRLHAKLSKDPSTKVGAVIVTPDRQVVSAGFNGFPRGVKDDERLLDREVKLKLVVHAEMNAILAAANLGIRVQGCTMYLAAESNGVLWSGPPCSRCLVSLIQAGISEIVSIKNTCIPDRWKDDIEFSRSIIEEVGLGYREIDYDISTSH
jgi:dCMP deaminase